MGNLPSIGNRSRTCRMLITKKIDEKGVQRTCQLMNHFDLNIKGQTTGINMN